MNTPYVAVDSFQVGKALLSSPPPSQCLPLYTQSHPAPSLIYREIGPQIIQNNETSNAQITTEAMGGKDDTILYVTNDFRGGQNILGSYWNVLSRGTEILCLGNKIFLEAIIIPSQAQKPLLTS